MEKLETSRLLLRHIVTEDAADIYAYCREPNVGPAAGWQPHTSIDETRIIMNDIFIGQEYVFGIILKESQQMIGTIGFLPDPHRQNRDVLMLGYSLSEKYWNKGLMTEAAKAVISLIFKKLPITIISCTCYTTNIRSNKVIEKCGFVYEGCLRQGEKRFDGELMDVNLFSMTRTEWENNDLYFAKGKDFAPPRQRL